MGNVFMKLKNGSTTCWQDFHLRMHLLEQPVYASKEISTVITVITVGTVFILSRDYLTFTRITSITQNEPYMHWWLRCGSFKEETGDNQVL